MELQKKWVAPSPREVRNEWSDNYIVADAIYKIAVILKTMYYTKQVHTENDDKLLGRILNGGHIGPDSLTEMVGLTDRLIDSQEQIKKKVSHKAMLADFKRNIENLNQWKGFLKRVINCQLKFEAKGAAINWNPFSGDMTMHWLEVISELPLLPGISLKEI